MNCLEIPSKFIDYLTEAAGEQVASIVLNAVKSGIPEVSIRINPMKVCDPAVLDLPLDGNVPWCHEGFYLSTRPSFTLDPALHAGAYYVQEPSSMSLSVLDPIFREMKPREILDLCAAPGGKSTHIISMAMRYSSAFESENFDYKPYITCNEVIKSRAAILAENVTKWGVTSVSVTSRDPEYFAREGSTFDLILVDAPCSGEGMFRKDPEAISEWSEENVRLCVARQRRILSDIWEALVPGGILVYSTCTFNKYENDGNLKWLKSEIGALPFSLFNSAELEKYGVVITPEGGFQFFPGVVRGEGFYFAVVRKPFDDNDKFSVFPERDYQLRAKSEKCRNEKCKGEKSRNENLRGEKNRNGEKDWKKKSDKKQDLRQHPFYSNITSEEPEHQFALSPNYEYEDKWPSVELSKEDAVTYLSRNTIVLDKDAPLGYLRVTYKGLGLGFVKNLGSRANNLYPMNWRIRKY